MLSLVPMIERSLGQIPRAGGLMPPLHYKPALTCMCLMDRWGRQDDNISWESIKYDYFITAEELVRYSSSFESKLSEQKTYQNIFSGYNDWVNSTTLAHDLLT